MNFTVPAPDDAGGELSRRTRPPKWSTWRSTNGLSTGRRRTRSGCSPTSPIRSSITTASRRPRSCRSTGAKDVAVEFTSLSQDLFDGRLAHGLRGRQPDADLRADAGEVAISIMAPSRRSRPPPAPRSTGRRTSSRRNRELYQQAPRRDGRSVRPRRVGHSRRRRPRCSPGRRCRRRSKEMGSLEFSKQLLTHAEVAVAPGVGYRRGGRRLSCASRWSKTSSGCARPRAT